MEHNKIILLAQLIDSLSESAERLDEAYKKENKEEFEEAKKVILDFQNKIAFMLK